MRINVYAEETSERVEITHKTPEKAKDVTFSGIQLFVGPTNMHTPNDDDSSAVVFWYSDEYSRGVLRAAFTKALTLLDKNPPK